MKKIIAAVLATSFLTSPVVYAPKPDLTPNQVKQAINNYVESKFYMDAKLSQLSHQEVDCLERNVFFESGVEDDEGMIAVAQVTLNRLKSGRWGDTICKVVWAKAQFSWTLFKKKRQEKPEGQNWIRAKEATRKVLEGLRIKVLSKSLFYHTDYIEKPFWVDDSKKITQIGQHIFYTTEKIVPAKKDRKKKKKNKKA